MPGFSERERFDRTCVLGDDDLETVQPGDDVSTDKQPALSPPGGLSRGWPGNEEFSRDKTTAFVRPPDYEIRDGGSPPPFAQARIPQPASGVQPSSRMVEARKAAARSLMPKAQQPAPVVAILPPVVSPSLTAPVITSHVETFAPVDRANESAGRLGVAAADGAAPRWVSSPISMFPAPAAALPAVGEGRSARVRMDAPEQADVSIRGYLLVCGGVTLLGLIALFVELGVMGYALPF